MLNKKNTVKWMVFFLMSVFISDFSYATDEKIKEENISKNTISNHKNEKEIIEEKENLEDIFKKNRKKPKKVNYDVEYYRFFIDRNTHSPEGNLLLTESH